MKLDLKLILWSSILVSLILFIAWPYKSNTNIKKYIIANSHKFIKTGHCYYYKPDLIYYEEISICETPNNGYYIILWGNRQNTLINNIWWNIYLDKTIAIDMYYKPDDLNIKIIKIFNEYDKI